jgi:hypothetical protein
MRRVRALLLATAFVATACSSGGFFRQYEYEEDIYLSLDGSATVYVNSSLAALNALRGASFDTSPAAPVDRAKVREFYTTPLTRVVTTPTTSRRSGRRFVHVRIDTPDVRKLGEAAPFSWSRYTFIRDGDLYVFRQRIGSAAGLSVGKSVGKSVGRSVGKNVGQGDAKNPAESADWSSEGSAGTKTANLGWTGKELVVFRLHLPSEIVYHNAGPQNPKRGNILVWEQSLTERLRGEPLVPGPNPLLDVRMKSQSILYRTLGLFGATFAAVAVMFILLIWWILRRGAATGAER